MTKESRQKLKRKAKHLIKTTQKSFREVGEELDVSLSALFRWQKEDVDAGQMKWEQSREIHFAKQMVKAETKELIVDTKKEISDLFNKEQNQAKQLEALNKIQERLMSPDIFDKMTSQAKIRDYLDLVKEFNKVMEGYGYADKVIVIGAPKPEKDILETDFEILED